MLFGGDFRIMPRLIARAAIAFGVVLALSACSDPYDPGQRALGGGAIGGGRRHLQSSSLQQMQQSVFAS